MGLSLVQLQTLFYNVMQVAGNPGMLRSDVLRSSSKLKKLLSKIISGDNVQWNLDALFPLP
jgi:hypothetical protein